MAERAVGCPAGQAVELHTVADNPHAWPGGKRPWVFAPRPARGVDGAALVLGFLARALAAPVPNALQPETPVPNASAGGAARGRK